MLTLALILLSVGEWVFGLFIFWGAVFLINMFSSDSRPGPSEAEIKRMEAEQRAEAEREMLERTRYEGLGEFTKEELLEMFGQPKEKTDTDGTDIKDSGANQPLEPEVKDTWPGFRR